MNQISNETLMAFADGELSGLEADAVRAAIENDADLCERLESMQRVDELLRAAFPAPVDMPERFEQLLRAPEVAPVVRLVTKPAVRRWLPAGAAIAAGFVGLVLGNTLSTAPAGLVDLSRGTEVAGVIKDALSQLASGEVAYNQGIRIEPVVSFVANDGSSCREVKIEASGSNGRFVACHGVNGGTPWRVEAFVRVPEPIGTQGYRQAGGSKDPVIDAALARLGVKSTLDASQEQFAIQSDWSGK